MRLPASAALLTTTFGMPARVATCPHRIQHINRPPLSACIANMHCQLTRLTRCICTQTSARAQRSCCNKPTMQLASVQA